MKLQKLLRVIWPQSATVRAAIISAFIGGVFLLLSVLISKSSDSEVQNPSYLFIQILDKSTGQKITETEIDLLSWNDKKVIDTNENFNLSRKEKNKLMLTITVPIARSYLDSTSTSKIYDVIDIESK